MTEKKILLDIKTGRGGEGVHFENPERHIWSMPATKA